MLAQPMAVAEVLGLERSPRPARTPFEVIDRIEHGLPVAALERLSNSLAPGNAEFKYNFVPKATLARRKREKGGRLSPEESNRLARIARIWAHTLRIWKDEEAARDFLFRKHQLLERRRPIDVALGTELGAEMVDQLLGGIEFSTAI